MGWCWGDIQPCRAAAHRVLSLKESGKETLQHESSNSVALLIFPAPTAAYLGILFFEPAE